jgi:hypothetical protein
LHSRAGGWERGMNEKRNGRGLFERLFDREYFRSLCHWKIDACICSCLAAAVTPPVPDSLLIVAIPLTVVWLLIRQFIACRLWKLERDSQITE